MRRLGAALASITGLLAVSCTPPEQMVVDTYLSAVRDGQEALVEGVSLVGFPAERVSAWEVVEIGPEVTEKYGLAELRQAVAEAKKAHEAKIAEGDDFLRENEEIAIRYQQKMREDPEYRYPRGRMAEFRKRGTRKSKRENSSRRRSPKQKSCSNASARRFRCLPRCR